MKKEKILKKISFYCCNHKNSQNYHIGYLIAPNKTRLLKIVICDNCEEIQLIDTKFKTLLFHMFGIIFWQGHVEVTDDFVEYE
jgi:hypothetical protein